MNKFEAVLLISPETSISVLSDNIKSFEEIIESNEGKITNQEDWGLRDLSYKINKYKKDTKQAKKIAKKGRDIYLKYFNSTIVSDYMLSKLFDYKSSNNFIWIK